MHGPAALKIHEFGAGDALDGLVDTRQVQYARRYLAGLQARTVVEEEHYFDRDYLAEHSAFYSLSTRGYANVCKRLHFFAGDAVTRSVLEAAAGGEGATCGRLVKDYLGFIVVRPLVSSPFGRTVFRWWDDSTPNLPRVTHPSREYKTHLLGMDLTVKGLAWQQQDQGVGGCATVALWSMLHSSALDEHHAIPTTVSITQRAHRTASLGARVFPSPGLNLFQISEAIKESGLEPLTIEGNLDGPLAKRPFSRDVFNVHVSALIRSGFPVLLSGQLDGSNVGHAVSAVGFRESVAPTAPPGKTAYQDEGTPYIYVHDDNIGPNVRVKVDTAGTDNHVTLSPSAPPFPSGDPGLPDATAGYPAFTPYMLLAAVPDTLRISAGVLHVACAKIVELGAKAANIPLPNGFTLSTRFMKIADYMGGELARLLSTHPTALSAVRTALTERVPPMSLHVGVARIGEGPQPLFDFLFDTSESDRNMRVFCHLCFVPGGLPLVTVLGAAGIDVGEPIAAHG
jgi:hypothetical protein